MPSMMVLSSPQHPKQDLETSTLTLRKTSDPEPPNVEPRRRAAGAAPEALAAGAAAFFLAASFSAARRATASTSAPFLNASLILVTM